MFDRVCIVILNWNRPRDTVECVRSCQKIHYDHYEIVVVDNGSTDNSLQILNSQISGVTVLKTGENFGYAGGNNVGIRYALKRDFQYVLILNNDTAVDPEALFKLVDSFQKYPQAGLAAPKVLYDQNRSMINSLGTSMNWLRLRPNLGECGKVDRSDYPPIIERDVLVGCAILASKATIRRIGFLDERFFLVHEDADWCCRNLRSGFRNIVVANAVVYHKCSAALQTLNEVADYYHFRNVLYLAKKNASRMDRLKVSLGLLIKTFQNFFMLLAWNCETRKKSRVFFIAVKDFFGNRMGPWKKDS